MNWISYKRSVKTAAKFISRKNGRDHISQVLKDLHWLPIRQRIDHKILSPSFSCLNGLAPEYLAESIPRHLSTRSLRSNTQSLLKLPSVDDTNKLKFCGRSFQNAAPMLWNPLPDPLKKSKTIQCFRKNLKSYLFK